MNICGICRCPSNLSKPVPSALCHCVCHVEPLISDSTQGWEEELRKSTFSRPGSLAVAEDDYKYIHGIIQSELTKAREEGKREGFDVWIDGARLTQAIRLSELNRIKELVEGMKKEENKTVVYMHGYFPREATIWNSALQEILNQLK